MPTTADRETKSSKPLSLSDDQMIAIMHGAEPLPPETRDQYLHRVASLLHGVEIGDGVVARACAQAQSEFSKRPICAAAPACPSHCVS